MFHFQWLVYYSWPIVLLTDIIYTTIVYGSSFSFSEKQGDEGLYEVTIIGNQLRINRVDLSDDTFCVYHN